MNTNVDVSFGVITIILWLVLSPTNNIKLPKQKIPIYLMRIFFVELKGVEPLSSCVINYAFYVLIFQLVLEMRRAGNRP